MYVEWEIFLVFRKQIRAGIDNGRLIEIMFCKGVSIMLIVSLIKKIVRWRKKKKKSKAQESNENANNEVEEKKGSSAVTEDNKAITSKNLR